MLDWVHLVSGSLWIGGLIGLLVLWRSLPVLSRVAGLVVCVPRFSNVAFFSVVFLLASGVGATVIHMPILAALWETSYGKTILVKIGLLAAAMLLGAVNLLRSKPRLVAARDADDLVPDPGRACGPELAAVCAAVPDRRDHDDTGIDQIVRGHRGRRLGQVRSEGFLHTVLKPEAAE